MNEIKNIKSEVNELLDKLRDMAYLYNKEGNIKGLNENIERYMKEYSGTDFF